MTIHLEFDAAELCEQKCSAFIGTLKSIANADINSVQMDFPGAFDTARQIGTVYSLFAGEDLRTILNGCVDQVRAMSMLFAAAGGLIEAQDEAVAAALGKATQEPVGLQSLGLMGSLGSTMSLLDAVDGAGAVGGYDWVGPEEVSGAPLARMVSGSQALDPEQFNEVQRRVRSVATSLTDAATELKGGLDGILGSQWQGEFVSQAQTSVGSFTKSVDQLATALNAAADKAETAEHGFRLTKNRVGQESASFRLAAVTTPGFGPSVGPIAPDTAAAMAAAEAAAEEQVRATINNEYSPAVMDANLTDLDIPSPYRVVSTSALGGANGLDLVSAWNVDGVVRPAGPAAPSAAALAAAQGGGGEAGVVAQSGGGAGTTTGLPTAASDAATEQALLASRGGAGDAGGAAAGAAGQAGAGGMNAGGANAGGVNASTQAAGTPFAPMGNAAAGQASGTGGGAAGTRGIRNGTSQRDRGFGSAAGTLGGGAAAAGAGAARMGGAGTLAGLGGSGVGGLSAPAPAPGAGSASAGAAGTGAGAFSSSSPGGAQAGRAGMMPMGGMMGAAGAGQNGDRRGHTAAGYLTNATNASEIVGDPVKVAPAVLGRKRQEEDVAVEQKTEQNEPTIGRVIGRGFTGNAAGR